MPTAVLKLFALKGTRMDGQSGNYKLLCFPIWEHKNQTDDNDYM